MDSPPDQSALPGSFRHSRAVLIRWTAVAVTVVAAAAAAALIHLFDLAEAKAAALTRDMAQSVDLAVEGLIGTIDVALLASADEIIRQTVAGSVDDRAITGFLIRQQQRLPRAAYLRAMDERGLLRFGPDIPPSLVDNSNRDYFKTLRDNPAAGLLVRPPVIGRVAKQWLWSFARRVATPDGQFHGVVLAAIYIDQIEALLAQISQSSNISITLRNSDLALIARTRIFFGETDPIGSSPLSPRFPKALAEHPVEGTYFSGTTSADSINRLHSFRRNQKYGFVVNVGIAQDTLLAGWYREAIIVIVLATGLIIVLVAAAWQVSRSWRRREADMAALEVSRQSLRQAHEIASLGTYAYDVKADRWTSSDILDGIFGIDDHHPRDAHGWLDLVAPQARGEMTADLADLLATGRPFDRVYPIIRKDDRQPRWVYGKGEFTFDRTGAPATLMGTIQDVTRQKLAEEEIRRYLDEVKRSNAELEQFAYVASHDLREPLRMVSGYMALLKRRYADRLDTDAREFLAFAEDGAKRLDQLVLDLLDLSRIGRHGAPMVAMPVLPALDRALTDLGPRIAESGADITVDRAAMTPATVLGDHGQVVRLFTNLIGNAIKFRAGDRPLRVHLGRIARAGLHEFSVADNGIGIGPEYHDRIFGIFQRLHAREQYEGTGIGLAICRKIVERHSGRIWLESIPGEGTTFRFTLPDGAAAAEPPGP